MAGTELVPRLYGSEVEYGVTVHSLNAIILERRPKGATYILPRSQFNSDGSRNYLDVGNHPEHATPECTTPDELLVYEIAGERMTDETYVDTYDPNTDETDTRAITSLHKRSIDPTGHFSAGSHENYLTTIDIWNGEKRMDYIGVLATHDATRTVFAGAGHPSGKVYKPEEYTIAQKMHDITVLASLNTTSGKPLVNLRGEHHEGGDKRYKRFHNTSGDALISPRGIRLKNGTMSIVLRLLEHNVDVNDLTLADPLQAAKFIAMSPDNINKPLQLNNGKSATALEIQKGFIEGTRLLPKLGIQLPDDELAILDDWQEAIDNLTDHAKTGEDIKGLHWIDWYTKRYIFEGYTDKKGGLTEEQFANLVLVYDQTRDGIGMRMRRPGGRFSPDMPTKAAIEEARRTPPRSRAAFRGAFIERVVNSHTIKPVTVNWGEVSIGTALKKLSPDRMYTPEEVAAELDDLFMEGNGIQSKAA